MSEDMVDNYGTMETIGGNPKVLSACEVHDP